MPDIYQRHLNLCLYLDMMPDLEETEINEDAPKKYLAIERDDEEGGMWAYNEDTLPLLAEALDESEKAPHHVYCVDLDTNKRFYAITATVAFHIDGDDCNLYLKA